MAIALVSQVGQGIGVNSGTTSAINTTGANLLVLILSSYPPTAITISDSKGNTWQSGTAYSQGASVKCQIYYVKNPNVGTGHTFTVSGTETYSAVSVMAFSGAANANFDVQNGANANDSSLSTGSVSPSEDNSLIVTGLGSTAASQTVNSGFSEVHDIAYSGGIYNALATAYKIQTAKAAVNPTWTSSAATVRAAAIMVFKAAAVSDTSPEITTTSLPNGTVGVAYSQTINKTGGEAPFVWNVQSGSLPGGLSLNTSTGAITGTPTTAGTFNFTARVIDENGSGEFDDQALTIVIAAAPDTTAPTVTSFTATPTSSTANSLAYATNDNVAVTGIDLDWSANGTTGWTSLLNNASPASPYSHTGRTPTVATYYRLRARDAAGNVSGYSYANATTAFPVPVLTSYITDTDGQSIVYWTPDGAAHHLIFQRSSDSFATNQEFKPVSNTGSFGDPIASTGTVGTKYKYRAKYANADESIVSSVWSNIISNDVLPQKVQATGVVTEAGGTRIYYEIALDNTGGGGVKQITVQRSLFGANSFDDIATDTTNDGQFFDTTTVPGTKYKYRLLSKNRAGNLGDTFSDIVHNDVVPDDLELTGVTIESGGNRLYYEIATGDPDGGPIQRVYFQRSTDNFSTFTGLDDFTNDGTYLDATAVPGTYYKYRGVAVNAAGNNSANFSAVGETPFLNQTYSPNSDLEAPVTIQFTDTSPGTLTEIFWDFGDWITSSEENPKHTYLAPGTYTVYRKARVNGYLYETSFQITVGGEPPDTGLIIFDEKEVCREYLAEAIGGPTFLTSIIGNPIGNQQRDISRTEPVHRFKLSFIDEPATLKEFLNLFMTRRGQAYGFRFFPPYDNSWDNEQIALTNPSTATYKLVRGYYFAGRYLVRRIIKPCPDLVVKINNNPAANYSAYTIDYTTGIITFTSPGSLPVGGRLSVTGSYCIPVYFATDEYLPTVFSAYNETQGIEIVEILPIAFGLE